MNKIAKIDKDFNTETKLNQAGIRFYSIDEPPFCVYGVFKEDGKYRRIPEKIAKK